MPAAHSSWHLGKALPATDASGEWLVRSPADLERELGRVVYSYAQIPVLLGSLRESQSAWGRLPFEHRRAIVLDSLNRVREHREEWEAAAREELGRTPIDLQAEWAQFEAFTKHFAGALTLPDAESRVARGVVAILGTYIWPLVHTIQTAAVALLAGNSVILKPSEKATLSTLRLAQYFASTAGIRGVFSILAGDRELGRRLACHEAINAIVFYGSFEVGMRVKQDTLSHSSKETLLFLGAKNPAIVFGDAPESVTDALIRDAFLSTGQHCRSVSQIWIEDAKFDSFCQRFHEASKQFKIGDPADGAYAGPLIDPSMLDRYLKFTGISEREGASILMRGKPLELRHKGNYVTPTLAAFEQLTPEQLRKSVSLQTEILSPHVSLIRFRHEDEIRAWGREFTHGLTASIWTAAAGRARALRQDLHFGRVALNGSTLDPSPEESYQAERRSGNHACHGPRMMEQLTLLRR